MYPNQPQNPFGFNDQGFGTPVNQQYQQPVFPHQTGGQPFYSNQPNQNFGGQSAGYFPPPPAGMYQNAVRPVSIETMNHIRDALWQCISKSDRNNDLVLAANQLLTANGGNSQLLEGLLRLGANYVALCQSRGMDYAQSVNNTAVVIHGAQIANQRRNFPHFVSMYPQMSATLDRYINEFQHILQATGVQPPNPMPVQHVQMTGAGQFQGTSATLGGQPPRSPHEPIPQNNADVSISIVPPIPGTGVRVGTMPIRSVTNSDGSRSDYMDLVNAAKQRAKEMAAQERAQYDTQSGQEQNSTDFYGSPAYAQQQQPVNDAMAELRRKQNEVGQNTRDIIRQHREEHAARLRQQQEADQYLDQAVANVNSGNAMPNWKTPESATTGFKLPHELTPQQTTHGGSATIYQTDEGTMEEIPVTFKHPGYTQPASQPAIETKKSAIDQAYDEVFGPSEHDTSTMPDYPKAQPASWSNWGLDKELDREELARAGIVSRGPASSGLDTSPFAEMEDSHIAQHYNDAAIQNGSIKAMDEFAKADHNQMYPGLASMSLMDITNLGNHEPAKIPVEQPQALQSVMGESLFEAEPFQSISPERKRTLLGTKEHRGIAPVYIAGRQRVVVIKSLGGGKITVEGNAKMNYEIHETELLGSQTTALTGKPGDINIAQSVLTKALETAPESHYRKLLEEKIAEGADLTDLLVDGPMLEMSGLVITSEIDSYAPAAQAALYERLGDRISEVSLDASINFNAFTPNRYVLSDDSLTAAVAITRAKTASTIAARAQDFFDECTLPAREIHRLHKITTDEVNRLLKVTFHPDYEIESFTGDVDDISTLLHENGEENVRDKLAAIYAQAVKTTLSVHTLATLKKRLADAEVETGLVEGEESGIFAKLVNVTLMPFNYADYPLAFEGAIGRLTKDGLPKLYEVLDGVLKSRTNEGVHKFVILTEDHQIIEFFKPVVEDDQAIYISRG